jgi:3-dehydroquinate synthase
MVVPIKLIQNSNRDYNIYIQELQELEFDKKVAVVTNPTVSNLHLDKLLSKIKAKDLKIIEVPDGEEYKNMDTVLEILEQLFESKFDRGSLLIAFGGGVIGDMTGFSASLYQRGIDFIQIPTTLLAQVDASVGGKTGVNNRFGKNLIGAFYQPKAVHIDPDFLKTLPPREYGAGLAEVIKMAVMFDKEFFEFLEDAQLHSKDAQIKMIAKAVSLKAKVVNQDEKEAGVRAVLNYGHTFGHVIENQTNYKTYLHGEAVAIGMVMANHLALKLDLLSQEEADRIKALLKKYNLPTSYKIDDINEFYDHFFLDKKSIGGKLKFILTNGKIGTHIIKKDLDESIIKEALKEFTEG